jgi:inactivated superfamily I helicase
LAAHAQFLKIAREVCRILNERGASSWRRGALIKAERPRGPHRRPVIAAGSTGSMPATAS